MMTCQAFGNAFIAIASTGRPSVVLEIFIHVLVQGGGGGHRTVVNSTRFAAQPTSLHVVPTNVKGCEIRARKS